MHREIDFRAGRGVWLSLAFLLLVGGGGQAQTPAGQGAAGPSRAVSLPLSGQTGSSGSVQAQQAANPGSGVNTVNSSVQVSGAVSGSIQSKVAGNGPIRLSLGDAVARGLATNLSPISSGNSVAYARASRLESLSNLLPNIDVSASETVTQVNLAAYGLNIKLPANSGLAFPTVVGPYQYSQLQGQLSQSLLNLVELRNYKSSKESERASTLSARDTRELVVLAVAGSYLQTLSDAARLVSQQAQVDNAQAIYTQAQVRKTAGTNARIDVMRSLVELQTQQQRLSSLRSDYVKQKITLARLIGLPMDRELTLTGTLNSPDTPVPDENGAVQKAFGTRWDLRASQSQVRAAEIALSAARAERYPSASVNGNYGAIGPTPNNSHGVFAVTGSVTLPVWQGGRTRADILAAEAVVRQRQAELADAQGRIESEVRSALEDLRTAMGQVGLAATNRTYAAETLTEARDRFEAGVATTVEVVQAQEQVSGAESDYIASLFSLNLAKLSVARATGEAETNLPTFVKEVNP